MSKAQTIVLTVTALASVISKNKTTEEISVLASMFSQLGDTLSTISTIKETEKCKKTETNEQNKQKNKS